LTRRTIYAALLATALALPAWADECSFLPHSVQASGAAPRIEDVAWSGLETGLLLRTPAGGSDLFLRRYSKDRQPLGPDVKLASGAVDSSARLIWNGSSYGLFFRDFDMRLRFRPFSATGEPLGAEVVLFPDRAFVPGEAFDVAWDQDVFFLAETVSTPPRRLSISEIEPTGAVRSQTFVTASLREPLHLDVVIGPQARFVIYEVVQFDGSRATQMLRAERGTSPRVLGTLLRATSADGFWIDGKLVLIGRLEPLAETRELTITTFDAQGLPLEAEKTFLETDALVIPGEALVANGEILIPYVSLTSNLPGEVRILRLDEDLATISDSRISSDPRFSLPEPDMVLAWTGTSAAVAINRPSTGESFLLSFCPLKAAIGGPALVQAGTTVAFTSHVTGGRGPFSYRWETDTFIATGTEPTIQTLFFRPGTYQVRLRVSDLFGQEYVTTRTVTAVAELPPLAVSISGAPSTLPAGASATFTASASGGISPVTYRWILSDGRELAGSSITVQFPRAGDHIVMVTATDSSGQTATASATVSVIQTRNRVVSRP
jgi:hypothetical protein